MILNKSENYLGVETILGGEVAEQVAGQVAEQVVDGVLDQVPFGGTIKLLCSCMYRLMQSVQGSSREPR